jgi:hypothetical protein
VRVRWGCDRDGVGAGLLERVVDRGEGVRNVESLRTLGGLRRIAPDQTDHVEARCAQSAYVGQAPEAGPNDDRSGHESISTSSLRWT